ncbi:C-C motif chemokine 27a [Kryptolebias marmoratus]|uniref:Chemokine interleukin-8-like domain-containing protein n=1 Tax=Kryptolebias marmoratus TaxID=37003 RepID=A0A3Q2Z9N1_KRYMA|nr:C-C motif chemokine 27a [Kryptolebias marmoratus]
MDLKVVFVIVCLSALAITSTDAGIPKCCISVRNSTPKYLWRKDFRWERQDSNGVCDIDALVVFMKGKKTPLCLSLAQERNLIMIKKTQKKRKN